MPPYLKNILRFVTLGGVVPALGVIGLASDWSFRSFLGISTGRPSFKPTAAGLSEFFASSFTDGTLPILSILSILAVLVILASLCWLAQPGAVTPWLKLFERLKTVSPKRAVLCAVALLALKAVILDLPYLSINGVLIKQINIRNGPVNWAPGQVAWLTLVGAHYPDEVRASFRRMAPHLLRGIYVIDLLAVMVIVSLLYVACSQAAAAQRPMLELVSLVVAVMAVGLLIAQGARTVRSLTFRQGQYTTDKGFPHKVIVLLSRSDGRWLYDEQWKNPFTNDPDPATSSPGPLFRVDLEDKHYSEPAPIGIYAPVDLLRSVIQDQ